MFLAVFKWAGNEHRTKMVVCQDLTDPYHELRDRCVDGDSGFVRGDGVVYQKDSMPEPKAGRFTVMQEDGRLSVLPNKSSHTYALVRPDDVIHQTTDHRRGGPWLAYIIQHPNAGLLEDIRDAICEAMGIDPFVEGWWQNAPFRHIEGFLTHNFSDILIPRDPDLSVEQHQQALG
jgi:hypothetical protein